MTTVHAVVLRAAGINCDLETQHALELAGAAVQRIHINRLKEKPALLDEFQILVLPGGFSYGDDVAAGKILANQILHHLRDAMRTFLEKGKLILGICNGFQVLIKTGLLPGFNGGGQTSFTLTDNDSGRFEDRWVYLQPGTDRCVFLDPGRRIYLPVAHGEGKLAAKDAAALEQVRQGGYAAFRYVDAAGNPGPFPVNPNGSVDDIAALTDSTGRILGLMPHPERFVRWTQHPHWTRLKINEQEPADGMMIFTNAVRYIREHF
ncbi:MAG TPA: phosphoribosylformylglycinamidine synthase I [Anaerohalosphaeraceae bacterium]|nr:phosphoribosylformylglycinamidine synthase I [Anaerohalosphaeraceae bacterium]